MSVFKNYILVILVIIIVLYILIRNHKLYKRKKIESGDVVRKFGGTSYGAMIFPKNFGQFKDFLRRFFLPTGFKNVVGSVAYWLFFTVAIGIFIFALMAISLNVNNKIVENFTIVYSCFIIIPIILMIIAGIFQKTSK